MSLQKYNALQITGPCQRYGKITGGFLGKPGTGEANPAPAFPVSRYGSVSR
jgi:hypothetical protein